MKIRIQNELIECYSEFEKVFLDILHKHVPFKKKFLKANYVPYETKETIVKRSELKSKYLKFQTRDSFKSSKSSRDFALDCIKKKGKSNIIRCILKT